MDNRPGSPENPVRVAVIGSGPSGFYAAEALQKQTDFAVEIDMFDRLPTPHGLVRGGVAPDHPKIKSVTRIYDKIAAHENFRFYGNVEFGTNLTHADFLNYYHQIVYAVGAQTDKSLEIPGEELPGSHAATEFVAWYNGHPDYRHFEFDLTQETAIVVGVGNVAMDVARILARSYDELFQTDIADYALDALKNSNVKTIYVLGRRGPAQAKFTNKEIREFGEMEESNVIVEPDEVEIDPISQEYLDTEADRNEITNVQILKEFSQREPDPSKPKKVIFQFLVSPVEIEGKDRVESVKVVKNELYKNERGSVRPRSIDRVYDIPAGLIFRSVGYQGVALPEVPFRDDWGTIPNEKGRIHVWLDGNKGAVVPGEYVVGWIKRGPSGVIGTNKPDSVETVEMMLEDLRNNITLKPENTTREAFENLLHERNIHYVTYADWQRLDELEIASGEALGRPRVKFTTVEDMLNALKQGTPAK
ncbi:MAG: FAD-dependent oxidoreductase [Chloroflexi bacterium]|nr:FAD-dependent oxidoreductase [Chloroflexota bacterium]